MRRIAVTLWLVSCAHSAPRPPEAVHAEALTRAACAQLDARACCDAVARRAQSAANAMEEDEALEQLALLCPDRRADLLRAYPATTLAAPASGQPWAAVHVEYKVNVEPADRVLWAAVYLDGARPGEHFAPGTHEVTAVLHVVSGDGHVSIATRREAVTWPAGIADLTVILTRTDGDDPFRAALVWKDGRRPGGGLGTIGVVGGVVGGVVAPGTRPRTRRPRRLAAPAFEPPEELRQAGAPEARIRVCVDAAGHVTSLSYDRQRGPAQLHPRHMGAALDWARRFAYDRSEWAPGITQMCEFHRARFDGPVAVPRPDADFETDFGRGP